MIGCAMFDGEHVHRHCQLCRRDWAAPTLRQVRRQAERGEHAAQKRYDQRASAALYAKGATGSRNVLHVASGRRFNGADPTARAAARLVDHDDGGFKTLRAAFEEAVEKQRLKDQLIPTAKAEKDLLPLVLFRGHKTIGEVQGLWNFSRACMIADVRSFDEAEQLSYESEPVRHLCGMHSGIGSGGTRLRSLIRRLLSITAKQQSALDEDVLEYLANLAQASPYGGWFPLEPIARWSPWSKLAWRRPERSDAEPLPEVWPFMPTAPPAGGADGFDLVQLVDAAVPKLLPEIVRQEVCQDLLLALLDGTLRKENLAGEAAPFVAEVFRRYPIKYGPLSLDAPPPWDNDGRTLKETLVASYV